MQTTQYVDIADRLHVLFCQSNKLRQHMLRMVELQRMLLPAPHVSYEQLQKAALRLRRISDKATARDNRRYDAWQEWEGKLLKAGWHVGIGVVKVAAFSKVYRAAQLTECEFCGRPPIGMGICVDCAVRLMDMGINLGPRGAQ